MSETIERTETIENTETAETPEIVGSAEAIGSGVSDSADSDSDYDSDDSGYYSGPDDSADSAGSAAGKVAIADLEEALKDVVDPELGINVVDLGLVYGVHVDDENVATVDMTLTSAACPLTDVIEDQARQALCAGPGGGLVNDIRINWVWIPPWGPDKITDEGRDQLRALGFNV